MADVDQRHSYGEIFAVRDFRVLWSAYALSRFGDQLARVALALLVYGRTASPALTAVTYAMTFLPPLISAPLLCGLADRFARRTVMVVADAVRCGLVALMAVPFVPLWLLCVLLFAAACADPVFSAARNAVLPAVLPGDRYPLGVGVMSMTDGIAQVVGFAFGGAALASVPAGHVFDGPHAALVLDAVTFAASGLLVRLGLPRYRPAPGDTTAASGVRRFGPAGLRLVLGDRRLLALAGLNWTYGFFIAPEALAAPYAAQLGAGAAAVGLLMAADPLGGLVGTPILTRLVPASVRGRLLVPLAFATGVPLVVSALTGPVVLVLALWLVTGICASYLVIGQTTFVRLVPDDRRAGAIGVASAGLQTAQGLGVLAAGVLAEAVRPSVAVGACGAAGSVVAVLLGVMLRRAMRQREEAAMRNKDI